MKEVLFSTNNCPLTFCANSHTPSAKNSAASDLPPYFSLEFRTGQQGEREKMILIHDPLMEKSYPPSIKTFVI